MKKTTLLTILGALLVAALLFLVFQNREAPEPNDSDNKPEVNFLETGNLIKDNPGLNPGVWYLTYEKPGAPGLSIELNFSNETTCFIGETERDCAQIQFAQGDRVEITGYETDSKVSVEKAKFTEEKESMTVDLYFYNPDLDKDESGNIACSRNGLVRVTRQIPLTQTPIQDTLRLLLKGELTEEERSQGIETEYPLEGLKIEGASLSDGVLTVEFSDPNNKTVGGSCRVGILWFQIESTAKQFPEVNEVRFLPEELFQP